MKAIIIHADSREATIAAREVARGFGGGAELAKAERADIEALAGYDIIVICASVGFFGLSGDVNRLMYRLTEHKMSGKLGAIAGIQKPFGFMAKNKVSRIRYGMENIGMKVVSEVLVQEEELRNSEYTLRMFGKNLKDNLRSRMTYGINVGMGAIHNPILMGFSELFSRLFGKPQEIRLPGVREGEYEPEIIERKKDITVLMEFKGVKEQDIEINLEDQELVVKAGDKTRRAVLPIRAKKFRHTFKNGVLEVIIQKT